MKPFNGVLVATVVGMLALTSQPSTAAEAAVNVEGLYTPIQPARPLEQNGKVEVIDVFWYGCPHCFSFLPFMEQWVATAPADVDFKRMPAIFRPSWEAHARAYYTARTLGVQDEIHKPLFLAIHQENRPLNNKAELRAFFVEHGVDEQEFDDTWDSFAVEKQMRQSKVMVPRFGVRGTPSVVVNGKYLVSASTAGSYKNLIAVVNALVAKERQELEQTQQQ